MKYMEALFERFCGYPSIPEELEVQRKTLGDQLSEPQRKLLLKYADDMIDHTEVVAFDSFVAGFVFAAEISKELEIWKAKRTE